MTDAEKVEAFDTIAKAMVVRGWDGSYRWFCLTPCGGTGKNTAEEAVADFVEWAKRTAKQVDKRWWERRFNTKEVSQ